MLYQLPPYPEIPLERTADLIDQVRRELRSGATAFRPLSAPANRPRPTPANPYAR